MARSPHLHHQETTPQRSRLREIHPAALTDGKETVIITCRALRANAQYTTKRLSELRAKQARKKTWLSHLEAAAAAQKSLS